MTDDTRKQLMIIARRLEKLPPDERAAVLAALSAMFGKGE
jgi:hypothetical protein